MDISKYKDLFVSESQEHLQALHEAILDLEREPDSAEPLERIWIMFIICFLLFSLKLSLYSEVNCMSPFSIICFATSSASAV